MKNYKSLSNHDIPPNTRIENLSRKPSKNFYTTQHK